MLRFKIVAFLLLLGIANSYSQEDIVKKIRQVYLDYNKQISESEAEGLDFHPPRFIIKNVQNRPALGPVNISISYYYDEHNNMEEAEDYASMKNWTVVRKVIYTESMPSYTDYKEVLYDKKGNLLFYYVKSTGHDCGEKRFYFNKSKLIKVKFNPITDEQCSNDEKFPSFTRYAGKLNKDDLDWEKWILKSAQSHKEVLDKLYNSTQ